MYKVRGKTRESRIRKIEEKGRNIEQREDIVNLEESKHWKERSKNKKWKKYKNLSGRKEESTRIGMEDRGQ